MICPPPPKLDAYGGPVGDNPGKQCIVAWEEKSDSEFQRTGIERFMRGAQGREIPGGRSVPRVVASQHTFRPRWYRRVRQIRPGIVLTYPYTVCRLTCGVDPRGLNRR